MRRIKIVAHWQQGETQYSHDEFGTIATVMDMLTNLAQGEVHDAQLGQLLSVEFLCEEDQ